MTDCWFDIAEEILIFMNAACKGSTQCAERINESESQSHLRVELARGNFGRKPAKQSFSEVTTTRQCSIVELKGK